MSCGSILSRSQIEAIQLQRLNRLLGDILPANRYYSQRLRDARGAAPLASLDEFRERVPFTYKQDLVDDQRDNPPFGTNLSEPLECYTRYHQTSATTGSPLRWLDTPESWNWMVDNWKVVMREAGVEAGRRIFFAFSFGPFLGFWTAFQAGEQMGCLCVSGGGMSSAARLKTMRDIGADTLCCTPTYALRLAEVAREESIDLAELNVKTILVAGEPGGSVPAVRRAIESVWMGARLFDHHGMTEIGPVSFESRRHPGVLHVIETSYFAEIVDPETGNPTPPGREGELVLTPLGRAASPLLRYRTGDWVSPSWQGESSYGRNELALPGGIRSRIDDMVIVRGVNVYPSVVDELIRADGETAEYRVEISRRNSMPEIKVICEPLEECADSNALARRLQTKFSQAYNLRVPVEIVERGTLPRFELKAKRWIRVETPHGYDESSIGESPHKEIQEKA